MTDALYWFTVRLFHASTFSSTHPGIDGVMEHTSHQLAPSAAHVVSRGGDVISSPVCDRAIFPPASSHVGPVLLSVVLNQGSKSFGTRNKVPFGVRQS